MADLHSKGVFHRDLKLQNLLIECTWLGPRVRIIDFGCGAVSRPGTFSYFSGTDIYAPPEYHQEYTYSAVQRPGGRLGRCFMNCCDKMNRDPSPPKDIREQLHIPHGLQKDFLQACLTEIPEDRITLDQLKTIPGSGPKTSSELMLAFQLVGAMADLHSKGVFHRDLKLQNLLIECTWLGPRVRIIDFGCGAVSRPGTFSYFSGTDIYAPPEYHQEYTYSAVPTTVWQIGAVLYELLRQNEQRPFSTKDI
ncbi:hypothetical protein WMY93_007796 [Mugilogobius chulae]|uniref:non-specific serine/threonine protein kinase n=1 Tax=Mugilogobius chulae TaxID=88201 RepID=A0AAW0PE63_9GOBI